MRKILSRAVVALAAAALLAISLSTGAAEGGFTATTNNSGNTVGSGAMFLTATDVASSTVQCTTAPTGSTIPTTTTFPCTGTTASMASQTPAGTVTSTSSSAATKIVVTGTVSPTTATYQANSCAPVQLANTIASTNPMLVRGGVTFAQSGTWSGATSLGLNGTDALASSVNTTAGSTNLFSAGIWFKAPTTASSPGSKGGPLLAMDSSAAQVPTGSTSRGIWMDGSGNLVAGTYAGALTLGTKLTTATTGTDYRDGNWHFAVATATNLLGLDSSITLYVDGVLKSSNSVVSLLPTVTSSYWHAGWGDIQGSGNWGGTSVVNYFTGSLANAFVVGSTLTAANVTTLQGSTSQTTWNTNVAAVGAAANWPLGDNGLQTYTGTLPGSAVNPCTAINVTVDDTANPSCVYPSTSSTACPALSTTYTLATLSAAGSLPLKASTLTTPQTLTTLVGRNANYNTSFAVGLHLLVPLTVTEKVNGFGYTFTWGGNAIVI